MPGRNPVPVPQILITADDAKDPQQLASILNQALTNITQGLNQSLGFAGPIPLNAPLDMQGNRVTGMAPPSSPTDAVTQSHAEANYSARALSPQLESTGPYPLKSYRAVGSPYQQEPNSTFLNQVANTAPSANNSSVTFGSPSGGFVPVTVSAGVFTRADGSTIAYPAYNDSLQVPTNYNLSTLSRTGGVVSGSTSGANTLTAGETVAVNITAGDTGFNGSFVLASVSTPNFTYNQSGADGNAATGSPATLTGTISLFGVYYYCINPKTGKVFRVGPYQVDSLQNRLNSQKDGSQIIAVASVTGAGGDTTNSAAGGTSPSSNIGGGNRIV